MYTVIIRKNATGEIRSVTQPYDTDENGSYIFWWQEGNMSCDCNRFLEFERAGGGDPDSKDATCGEGAYSVAIDLPSGERVYSEL